MLIVKIIFNDHDVLFRSGLRFLLIRGDGLILDVLLAEPLQLNFTVHVTASAEALVILLNASHARGQIVVRGVSVEL